jgi:hypothetical protein
MSSMGGLVGSAEPRMCHHRPNDDAVYLRDYIRRARAMAACPVVNLYFC